MKSALSQFAAVSHRRLGVVVQNPTFQFFRDMAQQREHSMHWHTGCLYWFCVEEKLPSAFVAVRHHRNNSAENQNRLVTKKNWLLNPHNA